MLSTIAPQVAPLPDTSSVYSFLGTVVKEHGEIDASVELLKVTSVHESINWCGCMDGAAGTVAG